MDPTRQFRVVVDAAERRQAIEREIDLRNNSRRAIVAHLQKEVRFEIDRIDELEKRRAWISVGNNHSRFDLFTAFEPNLRLFLVRVADLRDSSWRAYLYARR